MSAKLVPATIMKTVITHWVAGANGSIERASVENPAVAIVANACATARKRSMRGSTPVQPSSASTSTSTARDRDVEHDEAARAVADRVGEPELGAGRLVAEQRLASADAQARQHGEEQHDDPDAADPGA